MNGIDVSEHNVITDWDKVKSNTNCVIIRCGFGDNIASQDDKQFIANVQACERLNIPYGIYHYSYALKLSDIDSEIAHVERLLNSVGKNFKLGIWFDMEDCDHYKLKHGFIPMLKKKLLCDMCYSFCKFFSDKGYKTGVYASYNWLVNYLQDDRLNKFDTWLAEWRSPIKYQGNKAIWQYTSDGSVDGINGRVDMDYVYFDIPSDEAQGDISNMSPTPIITPPVQQDADIKVTATYQVRLQDGLRWLPKVTDFNDYAGIENKKFVSFAMSVDVGWVEYQAHTVKGKWLSKITGCDITNYKNGYAGNDKDAIDAIRVYYHTPKGDKVKCAYYQISPIGRTEFYSQQKDDVVDKTMDGYAGYFGVAADKIQIIIR